jgi:hypothetical protein
MSYADVYVKEYMKTIVDCIVLKEIFMAETARMNVIASLNKFIGTSWYWPIGYS